MTLSRTQNDTDETERFTLSATSIKLDSNGELPTRVPLFVTGNWEKSVKGNFSINVDDLKQMKENFDNKIGFPTEDASTGLAIDFEHKYAGKAGAWIKGLDLVLDATDPTKGTLYADPVQWTKSGEEAVKGGDYKCISPMGSFGRKNGKLSLWSNVTNLAEKVPNVLEGAGFTNIPFLRGMSPVRADRETDLHTENNNVIYVYDVQQTKEQKMNLDALRVKSAEELEGKEYKFVAEHKDELSAEELKKFSLEVAEVDKTELSAEDKDLLAAIKSGDKKVVGASDEIVEKTRLDALEKTALDYQTEKAQSVVDKHIKRGAVKQDQRAFFTKQLLDANSPETRTGFETMLDNLPSNESLATEQGTSEDIAAGSTAREQLSTLAAEKVKKAAEDGKELLYADALKAAVRENADLQKQDLVEQGIK